MNFHLVLEVFSKPMMIEFKIMLKRERFSQNAMGKQIRTQYFIRTRKCRHE